VWSFGILTATLLTGRPPFDTDSMSNIVEIRCHSLSIVVFTAIHGTLNKVAQEIYELPSNFSEEAQDLVNSTLKKTAELRPNIIGMYEQFVDENISYHVY
jgi:serine/threonine protein kinase